MKKFQRLLAITLLHTTTWLWRFLVTALIFLAVFISVGREMAPLLKDNKEWLEKHLTSLSGYSVQMASVEARWEGLLPELRATQLSIGNTANIDRALLRVDLWRSALSRTLVFDGLTVSGAEINIPITASDDKTPDMHVALEFVFGSASIHLRNITVRLQRAHSEELVIHIPDMDVGNAGKQHWLQGSFLVGDADHAVEVISAFTGNASDILEGEGRAYLDFGDGSKVRKVLGFIINNPDLPFSIGNPGGAKGRAWFDWRNNKLNWTAAVNIENLDIESLGYRVSYAGNLAGKLLVHDGLLDSLSGLSGYELTMGMPQGELLINQNSYPVPNWGFHYRSNDVALMHQPGVSIAVPEFDLAHLDDYRGLMTQAELRKTLDTLKPRGLLRRVTLAVPLGKNSAVKPLLRANLEQVSVAAWQGAPALEKVDAYLETTADTGFVEVESRYGFSMHFPDLYAKAMTYEQVRGRVSWHIDPRDHAVYVGSQGIDLKGEDGEGRAAFWVDIPARKSHRANEMYLTVGLKNSQVIYRNKYLPNTLPDTLQGWLKDSIKGGDIIENGFIYRGSLRSGEEQERSILYFGKLKNGILKFDPAWPLLSDINATLVVDNHDVRADVTQARLQNLILNKAVVGVKAGSFLTIQGEVKGNGNNALDILRKTPLRKTLGSTFDAWQMEGNVSGRLDLGISLDHHTENDFQDVAIKLKRNNLTLKDIDLPLEQLTGDLHYSSTLGLSAPQLSARLWGRPQKISIVPEVDGDSLPDIAINVQGVIEPAKLAEWSHLSFIHFLQGAIPVQGKLEIPLDIAHSEVMNPFATLNFFSDLQGVSLDLPAPLKKTADISQPLVVTVNLFKDHQAYDVLYGALSIARIEIPAQAALRGQVWVNQPAEESIETLPEGLHIHGYLEKGLLEDWMKVVDRYAKLELAKPASVSATDKNETLSPVFHLALDEFQIGELALGSTRLSVTHIEGSDSAWQANFDHGAANGQYRYFDDATRTPELDFNRLDLDQWKRLQGGEQTTEIADEPLEVPDPLENVIPQDLPALKIEVKQLIHDAVDLGRWRFIIHPQQWGASLENFSAVMKGVKIGAISGDQGASIQWRRDKDVVETAIDARITQTEEVDSVKSLFGTDRIVEAEKTELAASLIWKGSPVNMQFRNLKGDVKIRSEKGRFLNSTTSTDLMRVINVFNFTTWARRLKLDFSDLYKTGVSYDKVTGHVQLDHGKVIFDEPLVMESPSSRFVLQGNIDSVANTIDADLSVTLPVSSNAAWITALAAGLPAAAGVWAVSKIFESQIDNLSSVSYTISGELDDPDIKFKHLLKDLPGKEKTKPVKEVTPAEIAD